MMFVTLTDMSHASWYIDEDLVLELQSEPF